LLILLDFTDIHALGWPLDTISLGKGNLVFHDYGKQVYTFYHRPTGKALRFSAKPLRPVETERYDITAVRNRMLGGTASEEDRRIWRQQRDLKIQIVLQSPVEKILDNDASLVSYTIARQVMPGFTPGYILASVKMKEDPTLILVAQLTDVKPDDLEIGMELTMVPKIIKQLMSGQKVVSYCFSPKDPAKVTPGEGGQIQ
jgi:hypothetical protein